MPKKSNKRKLDDGDVTPSSNKKIRFEDDQLTTTISGQYVITNSADKQIPSLFGVMLNQHETDKTTYTGRFKYTSRNDPVDEFWKEIIKAIVLDACDCQQLDVRNKIYIYNLVVQKWTESEAASYADDPDYSSSLKDKDKNKNCINVAYVQNSFTYIIIGDKDVDISLEINRDKIS